MSNMLQNENTNWSNRSEFWLRQSNSLVIPRALRNRRRFPIILNGDGVHMRIEKGTLHIRNGFTHYPQEQESYRFFRGDLDLPTRIVAMDCSGSLSFDVLAWLAEQGVALICLDWKGDGSSILSCTGYAGDAAKVAWQRETRANDAARLAFAVDLIRRKIVASIVTLETHIPLSRSRDLALEKARNGIERLDDAGFADLNAIFAVEGECASAYFAAWRGLPIAWKGTGQHPIPDAWRSYKGRSSLATGIKPENRNASHPVNAMLNYAYAVKLAGLQVQAIADGYDPMIGVMHKGKRGNPAFVLDLIEPERPAIDAAILTFFAKHTFAGADFVIRANGGCRLSPQLARTIATIIFGSDAVRKPAASPKRRPSRLVETALA